MLIYNLLYRNLLGGDDEKMIKVEPGEDDDLHDHSQCDEYELKAHAQLQAAVALFLVSWSPYVIESMLSGYIAVPELASVITACIPLIATSLLPIIYMRFLRDDRPRPVAENILAVYVH